MFDLVRDFRFAARLLARKPMTSALAALSLALGIGVNAAIFSLVDAVLLRDPPALRPAQLMEVYTSDSGGFRYATASYPDYLDLRDGNDVFSQLAAFDMTVASHDVGEGSELLFGEEVSANYFEMLGLEPALGRFLVPAEEAPAGAHPVVVLGHGFWQRRFGGDPAVVGRSLRLNGRDFEIVGVAPEKLKGDVPGVADDYWLPLSMHDAISESPRLGKRGSRSLFLRGRLAPGVSAAQAQARFDVLAQRLAAEYPDTNEGRTITLVPSRQVALNPGIDGPLFGVAGLLMAIVGMVLLIACSNIANLLLARAADRSREIAVRLALGAGRRRLVRQLLAESLLLAVPAGLGGLLLAAATTRLLVRFKPPLPIPLALDLGLDGRVLAFTLAVTVATGLLCGLAPALQASRPQLVGALKDDAAALGRRFRRLGLRNVLVTGQVAVSTLLLVGAGLFLRSLANARAVDPGFSLRQGVMAQVALGFGNRYTEQEGRLFYQRLVERVAALPGVDSVALAEHLPLAMQIHTRGLQVEGQPEVDEKDWPEADVATVGPGYFRTMGIPLPWGRGFSNADGPEAPGVVVVNETAARRYWPGEEPLGKHLRFDDKGPWLAVVGVAGDGKYRTLGEDPRPFVYQAFAQDYSSMMGVVVASRLDEGQLLAQVRHEIAALDPHAPIFDIKPMSEHLAVMLFPARMGAVLLAAFGVLGLVLASVGLYGVVAYSVSRRTREVGIRRAVGAGDGAVVRLVVGEGMVLVGVGVAVGLGLALAAGRFLGSLLYGIGAADPVTFVAVPLLLGAVALAANLIPARRALRVDPMEALRYE
jgi:putative ABC transport system permease protein